MHVEDPEERDFPFAGHTIFKGLEGENTMLCEASDLREAYLAERREQLEMIRNTGRKFGYALETVCTDEPLDEMLAAVLAVRLGRSF